MMRFAFVFVVAAVFAAPVPPPVDTPTLKPTATPTFVVDPPTTSSPTVKDPPTTSPPTVKIIHEPTPMAPTEVSLFASDLCQDLIRSKCSNVVANKNFLDVMKCANGIFSDLINNPNAVASLTDAGCMFQMKGSLAALCTRDFERQCESSYSFRELKHCAHKKIDDFSIGCQIAVETFKEKYEVAEKRLWKHHKKHHYEHEEDSEDEDSEDANQQAVEPDQAEYQFLWGGEILSDPDSSKWKKIWHTWGKWVAGALGLLMLIIIVRCYKKRKARRQQVEQNGETPVQTSRWSRWRGCSRNFWQSSSAPLRDTEMPVSSVSYVEVPVAQVAHPASAPATPVVVQYSSVYPGKETV